MDADTQKAESWKFSNRAAIVLPVEGRLAVFNNQRQLIGWADSWDDLLSVVKTAESTIGPAPSRRTFHLTLEDLGLI